MIQKLTYVIDPTNQGLINLKLQGRRGIRLYKTCHDQYNPRDPGYVFYPADLQFFLDYENKDTNR